MLNILENSFPHSGHFGLPSPERLLPPERGFLTTTPPLFEVECNEERTLEESCSEEDDEWLLEMIESEDWLIKE